jgi:hypothetical protein
MDSSTRVFNIFILAGGVPCVHFMVTRLYAIFKAGVIKRRPPSQPFTKTTNPKVFWGFMIWSSLGTAVIIWGLSGSCL